MGNTYPSAVLIEYGFIKHQIKLFILPVSVNIFFSPVRTIMRYFNMDALFSLLLNHGFSYCSGTASS